MIGIAGSVAVGKSTTARLLRELLAGWPEHPRVTLVTTDGFLLPNAELERRGLMHRKGFPESYDRRALLRFVMDVKSGIDEVAAPVYDHLGYDIVPGAEVTVRRPDILIIEGLNVLQPARVRVRRHHRPGGQRLLRLLGLRRRRRRRRPRLVRHPVPVAAGDRLPRSALLLHPLRRAHPRAGRPPGPAPVGHHQRPQPGRRTSCPPAAGPPRSCARTPTTGSSGCGSARSDRACITRRRVSADCSCVRVRSPEAGHPLRSLPSRCGAVSRNARSVRTVGRIARTRGRRDASGDASKAREHRARAGYFTVVGPRCV